MTEEEIPYPYVRCSQHPPAPGFAACLHVITEGAAISFHEKPTEESLGQLLCKECFEGDFEWDAKTLEILRLLCAHCGKTLLEKSGIATE